MQKAQAANIPKDTILRSVAKGEAAAAGGALEEIIYEGFGKGGAPIIVEAATDNRNRTAAAVRHAFSQAGGKLAGTGAVRHLFERLGIFRYPPQAERKMIDEIIEAAVELGAVDFFVGKSGELALHFAAKDYYTAQEELAKLTPAPLNSDLAWLTLEPQAIDPVASELLSEVEGVQGVYQGVDRGVDSGADLGEGSFDQPGEA